VKDVTHLADDEAPCILWQIRLTCCQVAVVNDVEALLCEVNIMGFHLVESNSSLDIIGFVNVPSIV
jgi:hypothetical protein